jgi:hypothetical protein
MKIKCPLVYCQASIVGLLERGNTPSAQWISTVCPDPVIRWQQQLQQLEAEKINRQNQDVQQASQQEVEHHQQQQQRVHEQEEHLEEALQEYINPASKEQHNDDEER